MFFCYWEFKIKTLFFFFFQFSDLLLYAHRTSNPTLHFRVHGQLQVKDLSVLDSEPRMGGEYCFNIYDGKKALLVAANCQEEKIQWMEDIAEAAQVWILQHLRWIAKVLSESLMHKSKLRIVLADSLYTGLKIAQLLMGLNWSVLEAHSITKVSLLAPSCVSSLLFLTPRKWS